MRSCEPGRRRPGSGELHSTALKNGLHVHTFTGHMQRTLHSLRQGVARLIPPALHLASGPRPSNAETSNLDDSSRHSRARHRVYLARKRLLPRKKTKETRI
ncbi:uncharacterized protein BDCG_17635 [Blastomyces dermatitidis ER-3]|uniref:Uncharacterized protein n=1 Tax=Ajellomyces dermatitidis (strain ER-3 / ATCC MYA-2586) TaxID=559297 RepID=A0ABP2F6E5_AJEDR|nr:uncharacterized protein BDCG_17635 [Blastomyces dermatitidis ER-3]EEQ92662.2 hypothetical protein BDCG_17635 [Blastomyces dermatitidis ER-3]